MRILLTGATGLIGPRIALRLLEEGHDLVILSRRPDEARKQLGIPARYYAWTGNGSPQAEALDSLDAVVHLAGEPIAARRWTPEQKAKIRDSRVKGTHQLVDAVAAVPGQKPKIWISSSAIGFYGNSGETPVDEDSVPGLGFLADVCAAWEFEAGRIRQKIHSPIRAVFLRIGTVLSADGGALTKLYPPFRAGLGGPVGNGKQWLSWIHVDDLVNAVAECLNNPKLEGAVNAVSPNPVRNREFSKALGRTLDRPAIMPLPAAVLKLLFGELGDVVLAGQKVVPRKLLETGFQFHHERIETALAEIYPDWRKQGIREIVTRQWIPKDIDEVFPFFSDPSNLEKITPPWLRFKVLRISTPTIGAGTQIDYQLRIRGIPIRWKSRIDVWAANEVFIDTQIKGPYAQWEHLHRFTPLKGGTFLTDRVRYKLPLGRAGRFFAGKIVTGDVRSIFKFRKDKISSLFVTK
jgi:uncharacterized protein (TIGR01777 family)